MMRHAPLIAITCGTNAQDAEATAASRTQDRLNATYSRAIMAAGGVPVILPNIGEAVAEGLLECVDGLLLSGGLDIAPALFGEERLNETVEVDAPRDATELPLIRAAVERDLPVLAICRGIQSLNVALGGTLYQDIPAQIPSEVAHSQKEGRAVATHGIAVTPGSRLVEIVGEAMQVNSFHHQALRRVADALRVTATAPDGVVEAVEGMGRRFVLGLQFHPEEMTGVSEQARGTFAAFVEAARGRSQTSR